MPPLSQKIVDVLGRIVVLPRRISLDTPGVQATVPMLRGVWGAALKHVDAGVYETVFNGAGPPHDRTPLYVMRPGPPDASDFPILEWISIGGAIRHDRELVRAWDVASGMGLGPRRRMFRIRRYRLLAPDGEPSGDCAAGEGWTLDKVRPPCAMGAPARLVFSTPLRIIRNHRLVAKPGAADVAVAAHRRVGSFLSGDAAGAWQALQREILDAARSLPCGEWRGQRTDMVRYSGSQEREVEVHGVSGSLELPEGPGELWPLLAASAWLHVGKAATMGCGRLLVTNTEDGQTSRRRRHSRRST